MPEVDDLERANREILAAMLGQIDQAPEPGTLRLRDVLHAGDEELPAPIIASALKSAGYVYIYDTRTGDRSLTNRNMLPQQLKKTRQDGSLVFTTADPGIKPARGEVKCLLHPDLRSDHPEFDQMGFATCPKDNLLSPHQLRLHMAHRHRVEWATIEEARLEKERQEDREVQRQIARAATERNAAPKAEAEAEPVLAGAGNGKRSPERSEGKK